MKGLLIAALLVAPAAQALELYGSIGAAYTRGYEQAWYVVEGGPDTLEYREWPCMKADLELGVRHDGWAVYGSHLSAVCTSEDPGVNVLGLKYEFAVELP